jgi:phospholipid-transporting ATPase
MFPILTCLVTGSTDVACSMEQFQKAIRKVRQVQRMRKQRGYAFSQTDESQARVLQAYDTTRERDRYGHMASSRT